MDGAAEVVSLEKGQRVGSWIVGEKLGEGGIGAVFSGMPADGNGPRVAIKVLHERYADDGMTAARFRREEAAMRALPHPNIVRVFEYLQLPDSHPCIIMEYLPGHSLLAIMKQQPNGQMPCVLACQIFEQIATGLAEAHAKLIFHRDIKPTNVMGIPDPQNASGLLMKVLDFGLAKAGGSEFTQIGTTDYWLIMGTPPYMAPEQFRTPSKIDGKADVYSVGIMLFRALSGKLPFVVQGLMTPVQSAMNYFTMHKATPVPDLPPEVPAALAQLVRRLLDKDPNSRPTAVQLAEELRVLAVELAPIPHDASARAEEAVTIPIAVLQQARRQPLAKPRWPVHPTIYVVVALACWAIVATVLLLVR